MKQRTNQTLFAYWNEVRALRIAPRRFEIEPAQIAQILPETFILERVDPETYPFRLAGTRICEQFGAEFRGTDFLDGWIEGDRATLVRQLNAVCRQGGVLVVDIEASVDQHRRAGFEVVAMPLLHTGDIVSRLVGAISAIDAPAWLGTEKLWRKRILGHEIIWPDGRPHPVADKLRQAVPMRPELAGARLVRHNRRSFRVLDGGRDG